MEFTVKTKVENRFHFPPLSPTFSHFELKVAKRLIHPNRFWKKSKKILLRFKWLHPAITIAKSADSGEIGALFSMVSGFKTLLDPDQKQAIQEGAIRKPYLRKKSRNTCFRVQYCKPKRGKLVPNCPSSPSKKDAETSKKSPLSYL